MVLFKFSVIVNNFTLTQIMISLMILTKKPFLLENILVVKKVKFCRNKAG